GHADVAHLGVGVQTPGDVVVADGRAAGEEHVAHELYGFVGGDVRELHAAVNVAAGPDARHGRLQILVDDDEAAVGFDAGGFEPEVLAVCAAAAGDEDLVDAQ